MNWQSAALAMAGVIGGVTAVIHGVLIQGLVVRPVEATFLAEPRTPQALRRLVPLLMQFSTFAWLLGAVALIFAACWFEPLARLVTGLLVGGLYLFGAVGNFWANDGRHPGWMLMAAALMLIGIGVG